MGSNMKIRHAYLKDFSYNKLKKSEMVLLYHSWQLYIIDLQISFWNFVGVF